MKRPELKRSLVLEAPQDTATGSGGIARAWVALGRLWAEIRAGAGREGDSVEVVTARVPLRITVRGAPVGAPSRPQAGQRFRDGTRLFAILAVAEADPGGRYLTCFAREEDPA
ncbi:head-tail adaptor protein [Aphanothece microscopica]|uniref:head-tail adaptor protein n=1 Tax=Aphanothece microscopica TaxID=1049561 RepID=UPI0039854662